MSPGLPLLLFGSSRSSRFPLGRGRGHRARIPVPQPENPGRKRTASSSCHVAIPQRDLIDPVWVTHPALGPITVDKRMGLCKRPGSQAKPSGSVGVGSLSLEEGNQNTCQEVQTSQQKGKTIKKQEKSTKMLPVPEIKLQPGQTQNQVGLLGYCLQLTAGGQMGPGGLCMASGVLALASFRFAFQLPRDTGFVSEGKPAALKTPSGEGVFQVSTPTKKVGESESAVTLTISWRGTRFWCGHQGAFASSDVPEALTPLTPHPLLSGRLVRSRGLHRPLSSEQMEDPALT